MKHLFLALFVAVIAYAFWSASDVSERKVASQFITRHALRLGAIVLVLLLLAAAAVILPSSSLI